MQIARLKLAAVALVGGVSLAGCAYDMYGDGYGYGGYGAYGYGYPYASYGYGYGSYYDPFGWYGDFYYPGTGIFVFDRFHHRRVWDDDQRRFWESRRSNWQTRTGHTWTGGNNWSGWHHHDNSTSTTTTTTGGWHHHHG
jgi:hypothetical protein